VQTAWNHASLLSLGGLAPITVFIRRPAQNPLDTIWRKDQENFIETWKTAEEIRALTDSLRDALLEIYKTSNTKGKETREARIAKLEVGDFVLLAAPEKKFPPNLREKRTGPYRVVETISSHVYRV